MLRNLIDGPGAGCSNSRPWIARTTTSTVATARPKTTVADTGRNFRLDIKVTHCIVQRVRFTHCSRGPTSICALGAPSPSAAVSRIRAQRRLKALARGAPSQSNCRFVHNWDKEHRLLLTLHRLAAVLAMTASISAGSSPAQGPTL